jgi:hypothetical protein
LDLPIRKENGITPLSRIISHAHPRHKSAMNPQWSIPDAVEVGDLHLMRNGPIRKTHEDPSRSHIFPVPGLHL